VKKKKGGAKFCCPMLLHGKLPHAGPGDQGT